MKTKTYTFTEEELMILREAVTDYRFMLEASTITTAAPTRKKIRLINTAKALAEQFKNDVILIR